MSHSRCPPKRGRAILFRAAGLVLISFSPFILLAYFFLPLKPVALVLAAYLIHALSLLTGGSGWRRTSRILTWISVVPVVTLFKWCGYWLYDGPVADWGATWRNVASIVGGVLIGLLAMLIGSEIISNDRAIHVYNQVAELWDEARYPRPSGSSEGQ